MSNDKPHVGAEKVGNVKGETEKKPERNGNVHPMFGRLLRNWELMQLGTDPMELVDRPDPRD